MGRENSLVRNSYGTTPKSSDFLIREWLFRFGAEHEKPVEGKLAVWLEALRGIDPNILEQLFIRAFRTLKYFPKISEILAPLEEAKKAAAPEAAEVAWELLLRIRREEWNPDLMNGRLQRIMAAQSERFRSAARAAGIFRDFESVEQLHTWAKKRFIESFLGYDERKQDEFLLPDGELKSLLAEAAKKMELPSPSKAIPIEEQKQLLRSKGLLKSGH